MILAVFWGYNDFSQSHFVICFRFVQFITGTCIFICQDIQGVIIIEKEIFGQMIFGYPKMDLWIS